MKLEYQYPININEWKHEPWEKFMGRNENSIQYGIGLSQPDIFDRCVYFHVNVFHRYINDYNGVVFFSETLSSFRIKYGTSSFTIDFLFDLIDNATFEYAKLFHDRTIHTNLMHHKIAKPKLNDLKQDIQKVIENWDGYDKPSKHDKPNRLLKFGDLPEIPVHKQYRENNHVTEEQIISRKLFLGQPVSKNERSIFEGLFEYYRELEVNLKTLDYSAFSPDDLRDFRDYLLYAFNFMPLLTHQCTFQRLYRLVINEKVTGKNERIYDTKFLKYPSLEIVTEKGVFNRGSTIKSTLFYLTEDIDTAIKETKPPKNRLITVGVWKPNKTKTFTTYPVIHNDKAIISNLNTFNAYNEVKMMEAHYDALCLRHIHIYMKLLCNEYSKTVNHPYEYLISAIFTEKIFEVNDINPDFNFDCILYPSVANGLKTRNVAVKPKVADEDFELEKVIEFEIDEYNEDFQLQQKSHPEEISVAKSKNMSFTTQLLQNGTILWE